MQLSLFGRCVPVELAMAPVPLDGVEWRALQVVVADQAGRLALLDSRGQYLQAHILQAVATCNRERIVNELANGKTRNLGRDIRGEWRFLSSFEVHSVNPSV